MASYRFLVQQLSGFFDGCEFLHVPRMENEAADALAKIGSSRQSISFGVSLEHVHKPSVKPSPDSESIFVPDNPTASLPVPGAAEPNLGTAQPGSGAATLNPSAVVPNPGATTSGSGAAALEPAIVAIFAVVTAPSWALPISEFLENGVLPMDETKAWQDIAVRYGVSNNIITDNGTNFAKGALTQYCSVSGICLDLASVAHPQSNDQVEQANGLILSGIKPRLVEPLQGLRHYHGKKIKPLAFREGDLVLRLVH
ncbi:uncharacterized protein [Aegilops tauschii subsp. strangulata]|uniref:uncharacterized protein n=1 Tax=Aegilops tauschii subsp. strangulata TaxID=200361 RepID=UPI003CC87918